MGLKRVSWVRRYQGQCRALRPLGHQGYRLRNYKKDPPLCSGYMQILHEGHVRGRGWLLVVGGGDVPRDLVPKLLREVIWATHVSRFHSFLSLGVALGGAWAMSGSR